MKHVKGLRINVDNGEGEVSLPEWFLELSPLTQKDVLSDWIRDLEELYDSIDIFVEEVTWN